MQRCNFFMEHMRITQGYGRYNNGNVDYTSYSHTGSYALDLGGKDASASGDWAYAPCDVVVKRIYGSYNAVWFESLEQVMCADGKTRKLVFLMIHINDADLKALGIVTGKIFRQGEKFYREGTAGAVGCHIHIEVGEAPFTPTGWRKTNIKDRTGAYVWKINNQLKPHDIFFVGNDVVIMDDGGYIWTVEKVVEWTATDKLLEVISSRCEFFNSADVNDVAGKLPQGVVFEVTALSKTHIDGYGWAKIKILDGEYYVALLADRCVLNDKPERNYFCENCSILQAEMDKLKESVKQLEQANSELKCEMTEAKIEAAKLKEENRKLNNIFTDIENLVQEVTK